VDSDADWRAGGGFLLLGWENNCNLIILLKDLKLTLHKVHGCMDLRKGAFE
jgi:hypothetical protein